MHSPICANVKTGPRTRSAIYRQTGKLDPTADVQGFNFEPEPSSGHRDRVSIYRIYRGRDQSK